jgi:hypothetical protein
MRRNPTQNLLPILIAVALILAVAGLARAGQAAPTPSGVTQSIAVQTAAIEPGNYCQSCHTGQELEFIGHSVTAWQGGIGAAAITPCPAMKTIQEELYYTERMLLAIDRLHASLPAGAGNTPLASRLDAAQQGYLRLLDAPVVSLNAFTAEASSLRYKMGKIYTTLQIQDEARKRANTLIVTLIVSLAILVSLGWGWYNTRLAKSPAGRPRLGQVVSIAIFLLLIAGFFSLPLLRLPEQVTAAADPELQAVQTELDTTQRAGDAADRALGRAWMMGQVAAAWNPLDASHGQQAFKMAQAAASESASAASALWGEAASAQEAAVKAPASMEKAGLIAAKIESTRARAWSYRLLAETWNRQDPQKALELLDLALKISDDAHGAYRDLDRRLIALAYAWGDPADSFEKAAGILASVDDPALRAWGLREMGQYEFAALDQDAQARLIDQAVEAARQIPDPIQRSRWLASLDDLKKDAGLAGEALAALDEVQGSKRAFALAKLAQLLFDPEIAAQIEPTDTEAQVLAWLYLGKVSEAWEAAGRISDPYERSRAQVEIVRLAAGSDPEKATQMANKVSVPLLRDRAMSIVVRASNDEAQLATITSVYDRAFALLTLGRLDEVVVLSAELKEPYPLVWAAQSLATSNPEQALALVDRLQREADKADVLIALAAGSRDPALFERALAMAQAARVRGDPLAPARASLELALRFIDIDPALAQKALAQAFDLAQRISIK